MSSIGRIWLLIFGLMGMAAALSGCGSSVSEPAAGAAAEEAEAETPMAVGTLTPEQVLEAKCPHGPTLECDECRYEVGVVKADASLFKSAGDSKGGFIVTVPVPEKRRMQAAVSITGEIRMNENTSVHVSPRVPGVIRKVNVDIGAEVAKDDVLFTMDSVELGQALGEHERNQALAALSEKNYRREKGLYDQKAGSEMEVIEAQIRLEEYETARKASEQKLRVLGLTDGDIAGINAADQKGLAGALAVRAPMGGTVTEKHAVVGELASPEQGALVLADLNTVWVWGDVYERDLGAILKRANAGPIPVEVSVPAYPDTTFQGEIDHIGATMDEATRTVQVRTVLDNADRRLRPGMFCRMRMLIDTDEELLAIPQSALLSDEGEDFVFVHMKDDYYLRQNVKKGREFEAGVEILDGLVPGQTLVTEGAFVLKSDVLRSKMGAGCAD